ncbi:hypothetical protein [Campylobacter troglodytis]|uniref:hypothetical protein n=1 Tax=Campylobacter troglodytis TaxID=654363 RepID=UPI001158543B|nr:hypothetical protein [Campylobacter troglodytis]TQR60410.1 hypothetical protein DMC01_05815 [Campylobacter troglodytis]
MKKLAKRSFFRKWVVEVDESYFLLRFVLQLLAKEAKRVRGKCERGAGRKNFYFVLCTRPFTRRYVKTLG